MQYVLSHELPAVTKAARHKITMTIGASPAKGSSFIFRHRFKKHGASDDFPGMPPFETQFTCSCGGRGRWNELCGHLEGNKRHHIFDKLAAEHHKSLRDNISPFVAAMQVGVRDAVPRYLKTMLGEKGYGKFIKKILRLAEARNKEFGHRMNTATQTSMYSPYGSLGLHNLIGNESWLPIKIDLVENEFRCEPNIMSMNIMKFDTSHLNYSEILSCTALLLAYLPNLAIIAFEAAKRYVALNNSDIENSTKMYLAIERMKSNRLLDGWRPSLSPDPERAAQELEQICRSIDPDFDAHLMEAHLMSVSSHHGVLGILENASNVTGGPNV